MISKKIENQIKFAKLVEVRWKLGGRSRKLDGRSRKLSVS